MNVRLTTLIAAALAAAALAVTGCGSPEPDDDITPEREAAYQFEDYESEDCDLEDFKNREDDCGFTDLDRAKLAKQRKQATALATPTASATQVATTTPAKAPTTAAKAPTTKRTK